MPLNLTTRDKIAHLYRRFSFGGTLAEIDEGTIAGVEATIKKLIDYETVATNFPVHPYEFAFKEKDDSEPGAYRFRVWWVYAMVASNRPLHEKLSLFWHSHFAVSDEKVEHGMMMLDYLINIRKRANGKFGDLLKAMAKSPAMMRYLDMERAVRGRPNENFAREVMELFTMGIGNYSESDVKEVARALTGWGIIDLFWESGDDNTKRLMNCYRDRHPGVAFAEMPSLWDDEPKTILGVTKPWKGDEVLEMLASRPETARYISKKLWEFFCYRDPEPEVIDRLAATWKKTNGDIKQVMFAIANAPEFWSEKCYLQHYKSPADFVIGNCRKMGLGEYLLSARPKSSNPTVPIPEVVFDHAGHMTYLMYQQGLSLFYPEDVNGWKWGKEWINPALMGERMRYHGLMIWNEKGPWIAAQRTQAMMASGAITDATTAKKRFYEIFDYRPGPDQDKLFQKMFEENKGKECYTDLGRWAGVLYHGLRMMHASPDGHIC